MKYKTAEALADVIEANPSCLFEIDNDCWFMMDEMNQKEITSDVDGEWRTKWYGHSNNYGAGIAEALIILLNRRGFKIEAHAV